MTTRIKIIGLALIIAVALAALTVAQKHHTNTTGANTTTKTTNTGNLTVNFNTGTVQGVTAQMDGLNFSLIDVKHTYTVAAGNHTFTAQKPGYSSFSTSFSIKKGQNVIINATLTLQSDSTLTTTQQVAQSDLPSGTVMTNVTYFYDKSWAAVNVQTADGNTAIVILSYDAQNKVWRIQLGPGTQFDASDITGMPTLVQQYLTTNKYVPQQ